MNWGDGGTISQINNLRIYPRTNESNPHVLYHAYECDRDGNYFNSSLGACVYNVRVQIEDNWGLCSDVRETSDDKCSLDEDNWQAYDGRLLIKP